VSDRARGDAHRARGVAEPSPRGLAEQDALRDREAAVGAGVLRWGGGGGGGGGGREGRRARRRGAGRIVVVPVVVSVVVVFIVIFPGFLRGDFEVLERLGELLPIVVVGDGLLL